MEKSFLYVFDLSLVGSVAIIMVAVARMLLSRLPKRYSYLLWLAPAYLLTGIKPFPSKVSFDLRETVGQEVTGATFTGMPDSVFQAAEAAIPSLTPVPYTSVNPIQILVFIFANLWVLGMVFMLLYSLWTVVGLQIQLRGAQPAGDNVHLANSIRTPFVMGIFRPRIYLPIGIGDDEREYILLHERTHIRRCDHLIKPLAFLLLSVHWFNPLCWVAFYLMSRDMEMSCDEAVIKELGAAVKQPYAGSLLALAAPRSIWCGSPLAFGEGHAGKRIKNLLNYKKPAMWATVIAVFAVGWLLVGIISRTPYADGNWISQMYSCKTDNEGRQKEIARLANLMPPIEGLDIGRDSPISLSKTTTEFFANGGEVPDADGKGLWKLSDSQQIVRPSTVQYGYTYSEGVQQSTELLESDMEINAILTFALVSKAEQVEFVIEGEKAPIRTYTRDWATITLGVDPAGRSGSLEDFEQLYKELQADTRLAQLYAAPTGDINELAKQLPSVEGMTLGSQSSLVGSKRRVGKLIGGLPVKGSTRDAPNSREEKPFSAFLSYTHDQAAESIDKATTGDLQRNAIIALALLPNADQVLYELKSPTNKRDDRYHAYTRDWAAITLGVDPTERSGSLDDFGRLYNELQAMLSDGRLPVADAGYAHEAPYWLASQQTQNPIDSAAGDAATQPMYRQRLEAPIFTVTPTGVDQGRRDVITIVDLFLDYYTNPDTNKNWRGHTNVRFKTAVMSDTCMQISTIYDLILSDNPDADTAHWLATEGRPVSTTEDGKRVITDNELVLRVERVDDSHYALRTVTSYQPTDVWDNPAPQIILPSYTAASLIEDEVNETINSYRNGGLAVQETMGEGFATPPTDILWANFNYITVQQLDGKTAQATAIVDDRYKMVMTITLEGDTTETTVHSTAFVPIV